MVWPLAQLIGVTREDQLPKKNGLQMDPGFESSWSAG